MSAIHIEWLTDDHECETCGTSYAEGARVMIDGKVVIELLPVAHCYDGQNYYPSDVYGAVLETLGHTLTTDADQ